MDHKRQAHKIQPIERFPAKPRKDGRFQKRIRGRLYYFGADGDRAQALREYERVKHALYAGRDPRPALPVGDATLKRLCYLYLDYLLSQADAGQISRKWFGQCRDALRRFAGFIGPDRDPASLRPDDFTDYAQHLRGVLKFGDYTYNRERAVIVTLFRHAEEVDWIDRRPKLGRGFRKVSAGELRQQRRSRVLDRGHVRLLLRHAPPQLRAMILLMLNGGYGPGDCAALPAALVDLHHAIIAGYRRSKTNIDRDTPLWPETVEALQGAIQPGRALVFRTRQGNPWRSSAIAHEFQKLVVQCNARIVRPRKVSRLIIATPYDCRHTFFTLAMETEKPVAVKRIAGHAQGGMTDVYLGGVPLASLRAVVDHVRSRLKIQSGPPSAAPGATAGEHGGSS